MGVPLHSSYNNIKMSHYPAKCSPDRILGGRIKFTALGVNKRINGVLNRLPAVTTREADRTTVPYPSFNLP